MCFLTGCESYRKDVREREKEGQAAAAAWALGNAVEAYQAARGRRA